MKRTDGIFGLVGGRSGNPALRENTFDGLAVTGEGMTLDGTVNKSFALSAILLVGAWLCIAIGTGYAIPAALVGFVLAIVTVFKKAWAPLTAPLYAFVEGVAVGGISILMEQAYPGIVIPAVSLTIGILVAMLIVYRTHLIAVTEKFRLGVVAATGAVALVYVADFVLRLLGVGVGYLNEAIAGSGLLGIGFSLAVILIASLNLILDFDFIERGVAQRAPKYMEWYAAFGLMVTLVWLYLEILRLLARTRRR